MPLTKLGSKLKRKFASAYGSKKGKQVFYAFEHKHPEFGLVRKAR